MAKKNSNRAGTSGIEGSVKKTPTKKFRALLPPRCSPDGKPKSIGPPFDTELEARRALNRKIADIDAGRRERQAPRAPGARTKTVSDVVAEYITYRATSPTQPLSPNTSKGYRGALNNQIDRPNTSRLASLNIGAIHASQLRTKHVEDWMEDLARDGVPKSRRDYARRLLSASLRWAVRREDLTYAATDNFREPSSAAGTAAAQTADPVMLISWGEFARLAAQPESPADRLLITLLGWVGPRWSEAISLQHDDLLMHEQVIQIERVFIKRSEIDGGGWVEGPPKTGLAGEVVCPKPLLRALNRLAKSRPGPVDSLVGDLIFRADARDRGGHQIMLAPNFGERVIKPARDAVGLGPDPKARRLDARRRGIRVKDLRAYAASMVVDGGGNLEDAAALLRHKRISTTSEFYVRAIGQREHDPVRRAFQADKSLSPAQRADALWQAWASQYPNEVARILSLSRGPADAVSPPVTPRPRRITKTAASKRASEG